MRKKRLGIVCLLLSSAFLFVACAKKTSVPTTTDAANAWEKNPSGYEHTEYIITKTLNNVNSDNSTVLATGTMSYTLKWGDRVYTTDLDFELPDNLAQLTMCFELNYNNSTDVPQEQRSSTDTIKSTTYFNASMMFPRHSERIQETAGKLDYKMDINYKTGEMNMKTGEDISQSLQLDMPASGIFFDNETLFFAVRSFRNLAIGKKLDDFLLSIPYESFYNKSFATQSMALTIQEDAVRTELSQQFVENTNWGGTTQENEKTHNIDTINTQLNIKSSKSGPPITLKYSKDPIYIGQNGELYQIHDDSTPPAQYIQKLLLEFESLQYLDLTQYYKLDYKISDLKISPPSF